MTEITRVLTDVGNCAVYIDDKRAMEFPKRNKRARELSNILLSRNLIDSQEATYVAEAGNVSKALRILREFDNGHNINFEYAATLGFYENIDIQ